MDRCPQCGGGLAPARKHQHYTVDGTTFTVRLPASSCRDCRGAFMEGFALERAEVEVACVLASRARPSGESFRFMRKVLGMRAHDLADLLDVTAETVSRWENGQRAIDANAWVVVGSIVLEKSARPAATLKRLLAIKRGPPLRRNVRIDVTEAPAPASSKVVGARRAAG